MFSVLKKILSCFIVLLLLLSLINPVNVSAEAGMQDVSYDESSFRKVFPDAEFSNSILTALGQDPHSVDWSLINESGLESITSLYLDGNITNLEGLDKLKGLITLSIIGTGINEFPEDVENNLTNLKDLKLDLNDNSLTIPKFASLTRLKCGSGQAINIESKESIEGMQSLETLDLNGSKSSSVVQTIDFEKLKSSLTTIDLSYTGLQSIPDSMKSLSNLKWLYLNGNKIKNIPQSVTCGLRSLEWLCMKDCLFDSFPLPVLDINNLYVLDISGNNIGEIPGGLNGIGRLGNLIEFGVNNCGIEKFPDISYNYKLMRLFMSSNKLNSIPDNIEFDNPVLRFVCLKDNYFTNVPQKFLDYIKLDSENKVDMEGNFIESVDTSLEWKILLYKDRKQLKFNGLPYVISKQDEMNLMDYLRDPADNNSKFNRDIPADIVEYTITSNGKIVPGVEITSDGRLKAEMPGTYQITARIKNADPGNALAAASAEITVSEEPDVSGVYNGEKFQKVFPDPVFRKEVLELIKVNPDKVDWKTVTDRKIADIREFTLYSEELKDLSGLEKLTGLTALRIGHSNVKEFPSGVENNLKNLKTLELAGNVNPITIPKFVTLTDLECIHGSGQAIGIRQVLNKESKESIESMSKLKSLMLYGAYNENEGCSIAEILDYSKLGELKYLNIAGNRLKFMPESILSLSNLETLDMDRNEISSIPDRIGSSLNNLRKLNISECTLKSFPGGIADLSNLEYLSLQYNNLSSIPEDIGKLSKLKGLDLACCGIKKLPDSFTNFEKMNSLVLSGNKINRIPEAIKDFTDLNTLYIADCGLEEYPDAIANNTNLCYLDISNNNIKKIPEGDNGVGKFENLYSLNISNCGLTSFPNGILNLKALDHLDISGNNIKAVPGGMNGIGKLENLWLLRLNNCGLNTFPDVYYNKSLYRLELSDNQIVNLPEPFNAKDSYLQNIDLSYNNFTKVPQSVIDDIYNNNIYYNMSGNYISSEESNGGNYLTLTPSKQLLFLDFPESLTTSDRINLGEYLYNKVGGFTEKNTETSELYNFSVTQNGQNISHAAVSEDGTLAISVPGTYKIQARIRGADSSNKNASAETTVNVTGSTTVITPPVVPPVVAPVTQTTQNNSSSNIIEQPEVKVPAVVPQSGIITTVSGSKTICDVRLSADDAVKMIKDKVFLLDLTGDIKTESALVNLPSALVSDAISKGTEVLSIATPYGVLTFNIKEIDLKDIKNVTLTIDKEGNDKLSEEQKDMLGSGTLIGMSVKLEKTDGSYGDLQSKGDSMKLEIPYAGGNSEDTDLLAVYLFGTDGSIQNIGGRYDTAKGAVVVKTSNSFMLAVARNIIAFKDVADSHWASKYIISMAAKGLINGFEDGSFKPEEKITRAQFAVLLAKLLKLNLNSNGKPFYDVKETDWFGKYVDAAAGAGIIGGWDGNFKPNENISRQDAAVMLSKALEYLKMNGKEKGRALTFADNNKIAGYAASHVEFVTGMNIMSGKPGNLFDPKGLTTRAEVAKMIYVLFNQI